MAFLRQAWPGQLSGKTSKRFLVTSQTISKAV